MTTPSMSITFRYSSVVMFSQIYLMTPSATPFRRKDIEIVNILESTFMNTSNVLCLLDKNNDTAKTVLTSAVIENALTFFSHEKSIQILDIDDFPEILPISNVAFKVTNSKNIEAQHHHMITKKGVKYDSRTNNKIKEPRLNNIQKICSEKQKDMTKCDIHGLGQLKRSRRLSHMELTISAQTAVVIMLNSTERLNSVNKFSKNIPSSTKIIFFYNECMKKGRADVENDIRNFANNFWYKFRILFPYFVIFCDTGDIQNFVKYSYKDAFGSINRNSSANTKNVKEFDNRILNRTNTLIHSLYVYNPFFVHNSLQPHSSIDPSEPQSSGELRTIDLNESLRSIERNIRTTYRTILNGNGEIVRVIVFTTPSAIQKSDFPFLARDVTPKLRENPFHLDAYAGVDVLILRELARRMNFTIQLVPVTDENSYGWKLPNGTFVGALGDLLYGKADMCINGFFIKDYETRDLFFTTSIIDDRICVAVKTPELIPQTLLLFKVFTTSIWLLLMITFAIASALYNGLLYIVSKNNSLKSVNLSMPVLSSPATKVGASTLIRKAGHKSEWIHTKREQKLPFKSSNQLYNQISTIVSQCFRIIAVLLNASVSHTFNSSSYERVFVGLFLLLGLNLTGSFQGSLMDVYTTPREYPSIDTLEQLDKTGMLIILEHAGLQTDVFGTEAPGSILGNLRSKIKVTGVPDDTLLGQIGSGHKFSALLRLGDFDRIKFKIPYRSDGKTLIHVIPDCPKTYNVAFLLNKSSELYATINHYLRLIAAAGLVKKWMMDSVFTFRLHSNLKNRNLLKDPNIILTLSHLQLAFFALFGGMLISTMLFVAEVCWERKRMKKESAVVVIRNAKIDKNIFWVK